MPRPQDPDWLNRHEVVELTSINRFCRTIADQMQAADLGIKVGLIYSEGDRTKVVPLNASLIGDLDKKPIVLPAAPDARNILDAATYIANLESVEANPNVHDFAQLAKDAAILMDRQEVFEDPKYDAFIELLYNTGAALDTEPDASRDQIAGRSYDLPPYTTKEDYENKLFLFMLGRTDGELGKDGLRSVTNMPTLHNYYVHSLFDTFYNIPVTEEKAKELHDEALIREKEKHLQRFARNILQSTS
ncbi:MAG: hypothetical protein H0W89_04585 [Candidatus Levybacteria bacterium]|nr:hypothetical protein [Candidatus Levybacteria bacterium]